MTEQRFTDEEIKTLLRELDNTEHGEVVTISMPASDLRSILARLEAAEDIVVHVEKEGFRFHPLLEAWRRVSGK